LLLLFGFVKILLGSSENEVSSVPESSRHKVEVSPGENFSLEGIEHRSGSSLEGAKGFIQCKIVFKFSEQQFSLSGKDGATGVSEISDVVGGDTTSFPVVQQVVNQNGSLVHNGGSSLGSGQVGAITQRPDIGESSGL
jgi:hypothetical protein